MSAEPTLGELLSQVLREPPPPPIIAAGRGDSEAMQQLARDAYEGAANCTGLQRIAELAQALSFARLGSVDGEPSDAHAVVFLYGQLAAECRTLGDGAAGDNYEAQGFLLAETLGEYGDDEMADMVVFAAPAVTPGAHREAKRLRALVV